MFIGGLHRSHQPRSQDKAIGDSAAFTGFSSTSPHTAVPDVDSSTAQRAASPIGSQHNAICCDHQGLTLPADDQRHSYSVNGSVRLNGQAQQSEPQHVTGLAPEARRSELPLQRPSFSPKQKITQRKSKLLDIFRRPGRSPKADQASRGTLSGIAEPALLACSGPLQLQVRYPSRVSGLLKVKSSWMLMPPCSKTLSQAIRSAVHHSTACSFAAVKTQSKVWQTVRVRVPCSRPYYKE